IEHRKGKLHVVPDALSRAYEGEAEEEVVAGLGMDYESPFFETDEYRTLRNTVKANRETVPNLKVMEGKVFRRAKQDQGVGLGESFAWKLWVPNEMIPEVMKEAHDSPTAAHGGIHKTLERIRRMYYWPRLVRDVKDYVGNCEVCKACKVPNQITRPAMGRPA
ncbi:hypothetical protein KR026_008330, partial [Drosophila bipectinata]